MSWSREAFRRGNKDMSKRPKDAMDPSDGWVVIAAYRMGHMMRGVVEQVLDAGYPVVVIDNGSADDTFDQAVLGGAIVFRLEHCDPEAALLNGIDFARKRGAPHVYTFILDGDELPNRKGRSVLHAQTTPLFA
jgi:glycosyltransferase involved in cell wall biosynthesis